jgi:CRP-like cAMP-binding protein
MAKAKAQRVQPDAQQPAFDAKAFLESTGAARRVVTYLNGKRVFVQGQPSDSVMYIQKGSIKISVLSRTGKEAVVAMLGPGDFFGEGALTGQSIRIGTATATAPTTVLIIDKATMLRLLRDEPTFSERFISYMLARNLRIEADLVDHLFNSSEKRLAGAVAAGAIRRSGAAGAADPEDFPGDPRGDGRDHAFTRQLLHEQVQGFRVHRVQRRSEDQHLAAQCRPARLTGSRLRSAGATSLTQSRSAVRNSSACSCSWRIRFASTAKSRQSSASWPSMSFGSWTDRHPWRRRETAIPDFGIVSPVRCIS